MQGASKPAPRRYGNSVAGDGAASNAVAEFLIAKNGAGEGIRTLDLNLGKVALYH